MKDEKNSRSKEICVYYNSACPVCNAGVEHQKKMTPRGDIFWGDVHLDNRLAEHLSSDREKLKKYLHLTDRQGQVHVGIDAFIVIWRNSDNQAWLAAIFSLPLVRHMAKLGYSLFANVLYRWNRWKKHW